MVGSAVEGVSATGTIQFLFTLLRDVIIMVEENLPEVSILISTKNRREDLHSLLNDLPSLDYPKEKIEIVVVEETDSPSDIPGTKYIPIPEEDRGFGYTRNVALQNASKDIIVFIDDDCSPERDWLKELVKPFADEQIMGVAGAVKVKDCNTIGFCENVLGFPGGGLKYINQSEGRIKATKEISTLNAAYRKKEVLQAGGFEEDTKYSGEDYLLAKLISKKGTCLYVPGAIVYHKVRGSFWTNLKWFIRRGRGDVGALAKIENSQNHLWWILRSSIFIKMLVGSGIFYLLTRNPVFSILLFFLVYYVKNFFAYAYSYKYLKNAAVMFCTPVVKFVMDVGADIGRFDYWIKEIRIWHSQKQLSKKQNYD